MKRSLPGALQVVRCLLYAFVALAVVQFDPAVFASEDTTDVLGIITWALSGGFSLVCALRLASGDSLLFWGVAALQAFIIILTLLWISGVMPYPPIPGLLAVLVLALLVLPSSRRHFREKAGIY